LECDSAYFEYPNLSGLMRALTLAGMAEERDEVREHVAELEHAGKLPDNFNYIFETFDAGEPGVLRRTLSFQGFQQCRQRDLLYNA